MLKLISATVSKRLIDVSLTLPAHEWIGIVGPNGAGKSTLLNVCAGVLIPDEGHVLWHERPLTRSIWAEQGIALIRAQPEEGFVASTVFEEIAFALRAQHHPIAVIRAHVHEVLDRLNLSHLAHVHPFYLSGGEQHRVALASRLVLRPQWLLLDEMSAMLDDRTRIDILAILHERYQAGEFGIMMASHHMSDLVHTQRILVLVEGHIVADGSPDEIASQALHHPEWQLGDITCLSL